MKLPIEAVKPGDFIRIKQSAQGTDPLFSGSLNNKQLGFLKASGKQFIDIIPEREILEGYFCKNVELFYKQTYSSLKFVHAQVREERSYIELAAIEFLADNLIIETTLHPQALFRAMKRALQTSDNLIKHCLDTTIISILIATKSRFSQGEVKTVAISSLIHDIGLNYIHQYANNRQNTLSRASLIGVQKHPEYAIYFLRKFSEDSRLYQKVIAQHHEKIDGSGYPFKLTGSQILPLAQVLGLAEMFDSLINPAPFRDALSPLKSLQLIYSEQAGKINQKYISALIEAVNFFPPGERLFLQADDIHQSRHEVEVIQWTCNPYRPLVYDPKRQKLINLASPENRKFHICHM